MKAATLLIVVLVSLASSAPALPAAGENSRRERLRDAPGREEGGMSLDQAVAMAERRYQARVVRADAERQEGRTVYVLRLLNDAGRVWTVRVDAASGRMQ